MMSFSKHAKGFPSSSDGHLFVRNMHEFRRENRFFVMFWGTCPIGLLTGMNDSSQATMDSPVTIGRGIIWTLKMTTNSPKNAIQSDKLIHITQFNLINIFSPYTQISQKMHGYYSWPEIILCMRPANERWQTQNDPCMTAQFHLT